MGAAAKLKAAPDPTAEARDAFRAALAGVQELKAALVLNQQDIDAARSEIRRLERELDEANKATAAAPALQKRAAKQKAEALAGKLEDYGAHLLELQKTRGRYPGCARPEWNCLEMRLEDAEAKARDAVGVILQACPAVAALLDELMAARERVVNIEATLGLIQSANGIVKKGDLGSNWWHLRPAVMSIGTPDARWKEAIDALKIDPDASLPDD